MPKSILCLCCPVLYYIVLCCIVLYRRIFRDVIVYILLISIRILVSY